MLSTFASPLVKIQGSKIVQRGRYGPEEKSAEISNSIPNQVRSTTPTSSASSSSLRISVLKHVFIRQHKQYVPQRARPVLVPSPDPDHPPSIRTTTTVKCPKVIMFRFQTENGGVVFALGTKLNGTVTRNTEDVPFGKILDHVTPEELNRFENEGFEDEFEKERIRLLAMRPRGRPRKQVDGVTISAPTSTPKQAQQLRPGGYAAFRDPTQPKRRGRPVGWRKNAALPPEVNAAVPSFDGPQPTGEASANEASTTEVSTRGQSVSSSATPEETPMDIQARTGVYSMVAASGIVPIDSEIEPEVSRAATPSEASERSAVDMEQSFGEAESVASSASQSSKQSSVRRSPIPDSQPSASKASSLVSLVNAPASPEEDEEDERQALLRQFRSSKNQQKPRSHVSETTASSVLSIIKVYKPSKAVSAQPAPTESQSTPAQAAPTQHAQPTTTPARRRKRKSITPAFPGSNGKIPRFSSTASLGSPLSTRAQPKSSVASTPGAAYKNPPSTLSAVKRGQIGQSQSPITVSVAGRARPATMQPAQPKPTPTRSFFRPPQPIPTLGKTADRAITITSSSSGSDSSTEPDGSEGSVDEIAGVSPLSTRNIDPRLVRGVRINSSSSGDEGTSEQGSEQSGDDEMDENGEEMTEEEKEDSFIHTPIRVRKI